MSDECRIELLSGLRVRQGDREVTHFPTHKTAALLAYLAYYRQPHPREVLIELLWPEAGIEAGRHSLSQALTFLRRGLESLGSPAAAVITAGRTYVRLNPAVATDVQE